jgi:hypothetical protein
MIVGVWPAKAILINLFQRESTKKKARENWLTIRDTREMESGLESYQLGGFSNALDQNFPKLLNVAKALRR